MTEPLDRGVNTPGIGGYILWIVVSIVAYGPLLGLFVGGTIFDVIVATFVVLAFGWVYAAPVGVVGALVVHLVCRSVPGQGIHVAVAAGCGVAAGALFWGTIGETTPFGLPALLVGVAAGLGRAAVIPRVHRRRAVVEDDFRPVP